jgi:hypothetical protein
MKAPEKEPMYVNPDIFQGEVGTSIIAPIPMNSAIIYGENPNLTTNEFGQTVVIPTPIFIGQPITSQEYITPKEQAQQLVNEIKETITEIKKEEEKVTLAQLKKEEEKAPVLSTPKNIKPTKNYLLYGAIGVGVVIVLLRILKK